MSGTQKQSTLFLINGLLIAVLFYPIIGYVLFYHKGYTVNTVIGSRLIIWAEVLLLYLYTRFIENDKMLLWSEKTYKTGFYFTSVGAIYLLALGAGIVAHIPVWLGVHNDRTKLNEMSKVVCSSWLMILFSSITAGATEELIFRGYMLPRFEALFKNKYLPVVVSSLIFGLLHSWYFSISQVISATLIGAIFAIHYQWYRNIKVLILTHAVIDFIAFSVFKLAMHYHLPIK